MNDIKKETFSDRLNTALDKMPSIPKERGRVAAVAKMFKVSHQSATKWFNNETTPDREKLQKLCKVLDVPINWLVYGEEDSLYEPDTAPFPLFSWNNFIEEKKLFDTKDIVPTEYFYFDKKYTKYKDAFVVKIPQYVPAPYMFDNAYILFSKEVPFSHNGLMLVQYGTELALKRLVKEGNTAFLKSFSADIPVESVMKDTKILGQLIASQISADEFKG